jgi:hypothetical protein
MSRGLGEQQRFILMCLTPGQPHVGPQWTRTTRLVPGRSRRNPDGPGYMSIPATPARKASVRRSLRILEAQGLVEVEHTGRGRINRARITPAGITRYRQLRKRQVVPKRRLPPGYARTDGGFHVSNHASHSSKPGS